jgi:hypothetical protein
LIEVAWPGAVRQRWVARIGDGASEPVTLDVAKQAAVAFLRKRGKAEPCSDLNQIAANELSVGIKSLTLPFRPEEETQSPTQGAKK